MPDDVAAGLKEIAALLRRQVEQTEEAANRTAEYFAKAQGAKPGEKPEYLKKLEENAARMGLSHEELGKARAEERALREQLVAALNRQNALLEQLLARMKA
jgi:cation transport regulator ChaC